MRSGVTAPTSAAAACSAMKFAVLPSIVTPRAPLFHATFGQREVEVPSLARLGGAPDAPAVADHYLFADGQPIAPAAARHRQTRGEPQLEDAAEKPRLDPDAVVAHPE